VSPTLSELSDTFENFAVETLGKVIGQLLSGGNFKDFDIAIANMVPEEMPLDKKVFGPIGDALLGCKKQSTVVVFKDTTTNCGLEVWGKSQCIDNFTKEISEREQSAHTCTESGVLGFQG
jgi:hypothetical protein